MQTVAGDGACCYSGDGPAVGSEIGNGYVTADPNGNLFLSDTNNELLRWVTPTGEMITFAGTLEAPGFSGDGGAALKAQFYLPAQIARDSTGNTYVADEYNLRVRQVTPFAGYGLSSANVIFETQAAGTVSDFQPVTVSAIGPTTFSSITATAGFSEIDDCVGESLTAGQTCEIDVYFQPSTTGKVTGSLTIASNAFFASNPNKIYLSGTGSGLALTGSTAFGTELLKTPLAKTLTLTNTGAAVTLSKIYLTSVTQFSITGGTCPVTGGPLASKGSCTIIVTFNPQAIGALKSTLVIASNDPASPKLAEVTGTGTEVTLTPTTLAFGTVASGTKTLPVTVENVGTTTLSFTSAPTITGTGSANFVVLPYSATGPVEYLPERDGDPGSKRNLHLYRAIHLCRGNHGLYHRSKHIRQRWCQSASCGDDGY